MTKTKTKTKETIKVVVNVEEPTDSTSIFGNPDGYFHIVSRAARVVEDGEWYSHRDRTNGLYLDGLVLTSQSHRGSDHMYGVELGYRESYIIDSARAKHMHKTLTTLERRMDMHRVPEHEVERAYVYARSFDRFVRALRATHFEILDWAPTCNAKGWTLYPASHAYVRISIIERRLVERWGTGEDHSDVFPGRRTFGQ